MKMKKIDLVTTVLVLMIQSIFSLDVEIKNGSSLCLSRATCPDGKRTRMDITLDWNDVNCFCDDLCMEYKDCCPSADIFDEEETRSSESPYECVSIYNYLSFYMKAQCDVKWTDKNIASFCSQALTTNQQFHRDPFMHTPVTSTESDITYRNYFCAVCNYEKVANIVPWEARVSCPSAESVEEEYIKNNLQFIPSDDSWGFTTEDDVHLCEIYPNAKETITRKLRKCKDSVSKCHDQWEDEKLENLCASYTTIVYGPLEVKNFSNGITQFSPSVFRNYHCAKCNFIDDNDIACYERDFRQAGPAPLSFSTLFDFGAGSKFCKDGYIWDSFFKKCRSVVCLEDNYIYDAGRCVKVYNNKETNTINDTNTDIKNSSLSCDKMVFKNSEIKFIGNDTVLILQYRKTYTAEEYESVEDGVLVCVPDNFSRLMGWLTLLGIGISCICIIIHLFMFCLVPELRNLSGKNLASMSIGLLTGYVAFLIITFKETDNNNCIVLGSIMYYGFMVSFTWMNVMSYDVWRTLQQATCQLRVTAGQQWKKFAFYSLYAWTLPAIFLAVILYIDIVQPDAVPQYLSPELGKRQCWFGQRQGILLYFAVPLTVIMIINIILFTRSVKYVTESTRNAISLNATKSQPELQLKLYLRLALLMGLSWASGIIAGYVQQEYIWYIFILLNAFQGLFISVGFTFTKRIRKSIGTIAIAKNVTDLCRLPKKRGLDCNDSINSNTTSTTVSGSTPFKK